MPEQILELLKIAGSLLLFIAVWIISIAVVFRDINHRRLNGIEQFLWLAAVALIPLIGFLIYWVAKLLTRLLLADPASPSNARPGDPRIRITAVKPASHNMPRPPLYQEQAPIHKSTVPAVNPPPMPPRQQTYPPAAAVAPSAPFSTTFVLVAMDGPYMGGRFQITQLPARIGRGSSVLIQLNSDQGVSRQHAEIYTDASGVPKLRDLNSMHGTFINGQRITERNLSSGDRISVGQTTFIFTVNQG